MYREKGASRKLDERLLRYERESRFLRKDSDEYKVMEEVFDRPTLLTLYDLLSSGVLKSLNGVVKAGKEARIYWGNREDGSSVAVKIYLVATAEFKKRWPYILGDPRFKGVKKGSISMIGVWAQKEYRNLLTAYKAKVPVPRPYAVKRNVLVMEFIGKDGRPAPLLSEVEVTQSDYKKAVSLMRRLYRAARLVHADLSEYNIFKHHKHLILFDFGSAVDVAHPRAEEFLQRDVSNINRFFSRRGLTTVRDDDLMKKVMGP